MGYTADFLDNTAYGADDINAIRSTIAEKGVIPDESDSLAVTLEGNMIKINQGQALFADGCSIRIGTGEEAFVTLDQIPSVVNYVFLQRNRHQNNPCPAVSDTPCGAEDILLAQIAVNGTITDQRSFSSLKVPAMQGNYKQETTLTVNKYISGGANEWSFLFELGLDHFGYHYLTMFERNFSDGLFDSFGIWDLDSGGGISFARRSYQNDFFGSEGNMLRLRYDGYIKFEQAAGKIKCYYREINAYHFHFNRTYTIRLS